MSKKSCPFLYSEHNYENWTRLLGHRVCIRMIGWFEEMQKILRRKAKAVMRYEF